MQKYTLQNAIGHLSILHRVFIFHLHFFVVYICRWAFLAVQSHLISWQFHVTI